MNPKSNPLKSPKLSLGKSSAVSKAFVPPVLAEVSRLAAGVAAVNAGTSLGTGSATGNPRNKCALQPGHSLMDWIRLGSSGRDLTGVGSRAGQLTVTPAQLKEHNKITDAWLAIRGKVYNVTEYMPFHPGGPDELMRGVGIDATSLFDEVHPWVNYESILQKCFVGRLVNIDPSINKEALFDGTDKKQTSTQSSSDQQQNANGAPAAASAVAPKINDDSKSFALPPPTPTAVTDKPIIVKPINPLPRFDWIQKTDSINLIFYSKALCNPQVEITPPDNENRVQIMLIYEQFLYTNEVTFSNSIKWPSQLKINYETGKVEVIFKKLESRIWETYGLLKQTSEEFHAKTHKFLYKLVKKSSVNHNTNLFEFQRVDGTRLAVPLGKHVRVFSKLKNEVSKCYTAVPNCCFDKFKPQTFTTDNVCLLVKTNPTGTVSKFLGSLNKDDTVELSRPLGNFDLKSIENREVFLMLAAGTGITPMLTLILFLLERRIRKSQSVKLMFFNKTEDDILLRKELDSLHVDEARFNVEYVLSEPVGKWKGPIGRISSKILQDSIKAQLENTVYKKNDIFAMICGPDPFTENANSLLKALEFDPNQIHLFQG